MSDSLPHARRAIEIERASHRRPIPIEILETSWIAAKVCKARVSSRVPLDPKECAGGWLNREPDLGVERVQGEVLEVNPHEEVIYLGLAEDAELPSPGPITLWLFDYLKAPWLLLTNPRFHHLLDRLRSRLEAAIAPNPQPVPADGVERSWAHDHVCVWGPPGTGKTHTLVHQTAELLRDPSERVLLVSTTNRATDEIAVRLGRLLKDEGRLRGCMRLGSILRPAEFAGLMEMLPEQDVDLLQQRADVRQRLNHTHDSDERAVLGAELRALTAGQISLALRPNDPQHRCVVTTLFGALSALISPNVTPLLDTQPPFTTVVIDEAGLVSRVSAAAVSLLASRRLVLIGDPKQLSPIAKAARSMPREVLDWIARSALDHLPHAEPSPAVQRLLVQRRMHPEICEAVSSLSYSNALQSAPGLEDRPLGNRLLERGPRAIWYVLDELAVSRVELHSRRGAKGRSRMRPVVTRVLEDLLEVHPELAAMELLFISPFRAQRDLVHTWITKRHLSWRAATVHEQQGSEADVVVFDTVHASSTTWSAVEWVRLVNVGLSRARHLVLLLASRSELDQPWLRPLRDSLSPRVLRQEGEVLRWHTVPAVLEPPQSLFAAPEPAPVAAESDVVIDGPDSRLGAQLARRKALRPVLSREQARLIHRDLADAGPRLVRGVAGSGKTLVLAHWLVRLLHGQGVPSVLVLYANRSLRHLLESMLDHAWTSMHPVPGPFPWDRVQITHIADFLRGLLEEHELPPPGGADDHNGYDYSNQARRLLTLDLDERLPPTFVDEAQDFGHSTLELIVRLGRRVEEGRKPVLVFYDNVQNVYQRGTPRWREIGLDLRGRSDVMRESFRSTRPNVELALDVLHRLRPLEEDPDLRELTRSTPPLLVQDRQGWWHAGFCAVDGQRPVVKLFDSREEEIRLIARQVHAWVVRDGVHPGDIRVLALRNTRDALLAALRHELRGHAEVLRLTIEGYAEGKDAVVVTTPHSFKGHDAEVIVVAGADGYVAKGRPLHAPLYVALTRARTLLLLTATRATPGSAGDRVVSALEEAGRRHG